MAIPPDAPRPIRVVKPAIHSFAERVAVNVGFVPGQPLESIVSKLGGQISFRSATIFSGGPPESMVVNDERNFVIFLPSMTSMERDRFTIAHELGHLFLHYPQFKASNPSIPMKATRWVDASDPEQQRAEWEANWFAAAFLMPGGAFSACWRGVVRDAASRFAVSTQAAEIRAKDLGLSVK